MKKIILITLSIGTLLSFTACSKFLDVYPDDKLIYEQVIAEEKSINNQLNGIYLNIAQSNLYGANLSATVLESMAQQYNLPSTDQNLYRHARYEYNQANVKSTFAAIWSLMYKQILTVNDFMRIVNNATVTIPKERKDILLGEAYALRAFLHFDLLRLYGPVYNSTDSTSVTMPFNNMGEGQLLPLLPANEVMAHIVADLQQAEILLQNDPIITTGIVKTKTQNPVEDFYINRHYRMNYYAVKALQARAQLWRGNKPAALAAAKAVIEAPLVQNKKLFNWTATNNTTDRIFFTEVIFGVYNRSMYTQYDIYFAGNATAGNYLAPLENRLKAIFTGPGNTENDYRYTRIWQVTAGQSTESFVKYYRPTDLSDTTSAYFQPLIRKSEMYFIAAECEPDPAIGATYIEDVQKQRGYQTTSVTLSEDVIRNEYRKEMYGEGQLFYYYKRVKAGIGTTDIPDGSSDSGNVGMTTDKYRVPLPDKEQEIQPN